MAGWKSKKKIKRFAKKCNLHEATSTETSAQRKWGHDFARRNESRNCGLCNPVHAMND